jgi:hypothetical protein
MHKFEHNSTQILLCFEEYRDSKFTNSLVRAKEITNEMQNQNSKHLSRGKKENYSSMKEANQWKMQNKILELTVS